MASGGDAPVSNQIWGSQQTPFTGSPMNTHRYLGEGLLHLEVGAIA